MNAYELSVRGSTSFTSEPSELFVSPEVRARTHGTAA